MKKSFLLLLLFGLFFWRVMESSADSPDENRQGTLTVTLFYEEEKTVTVKEALRGLSLEIKPETVGILIGPEGGFSDQEAESIVKAGGISVSMGKTILRVETASAAALSMVMYELEL